MQIGLAVSIKHLYDIYPPHGYYPSLPTAASFDTYSSHRYRGDVQTPTAVPVIAPPTSHCSRPDPRKRTTRPQPPNPYHDSTRHSSRHRQQTWHHIYIPTPLSSPSISTLSTTEQAISNIPRQLCCPPARVIDTSPLATSLRLFASSYTIGRSVEGCLDEASGWLHRGKRGAWRVWLGVGKEKK